MTVVSATFVDPNTWTGAVFSGTWVKVCHTREAVEPATGARLATVGMAGAREVRTSALAAATAQAGWETTLSEERAAVMRQAAAVAEENGSEIVEWIVRESGSTRSKAETELSLTIRALCEAAGLPSSDGGKVLPSANGTLSVARRRPVGVVGVISPFDFPLYLAMRAVAPALALGNAVVVKPDPRTSVCGGVVLARMFEAAGLPAGVLHVLPGDDGVGVALTEDPDVAMIQFTGSTAAGRHVGEAAGRHLKKVSLELGGKNSLIVLDDADPALAATNAAWGAYRHQGQIGLSVGRVLVHRDLHDELVDRLVDKAVSLSVGDPWSQDVGLGPLIDAAARDRVTDLVDAAVAAGATVAVGGEPDGLFFPATVLTGMTRDNPAFREEIFGPVSVVMPFESDEEAVELANTGPYGLAAGIVTPDVGRAMTMAGRLRAGLLHVNDQTVNDDVVNPFSGMGESGNGAGVGGPANLDGFTTWQWTTVKSAAPDYPM